MPLQRARFMPVNADIHAAQLDIPLLNLEAACVLFGRGKAEVLEDKLYLEMPARSGLIMHINS